MNRNVLAAIVVGVGISGCRAKQAAQQPIPEPDYARQLRPGEPALRLITDSARMPNLAGVYQAPRDNPILLDSLDRSLAWFAKPSSRQFYPFGPVTHDQARASVAAFAQVLQSASDPKAFADEVVRLFDVYESVGCDGQGTVLFTGYYAPTFNASRSRTGKFQYPLYKRPADLASNPKTGEPLGRRMPDGRIVPYATRKQIEDSKMLAGTELVWLEDALCAYIVHVNGSAKLWLDNGQEMYVGYAGKTDRPYLGLGKLMVDAGLINPNELSLQRIREMFRSDPQRVTDLMNRNESYVFFTEYSADKWPCGSLGVRVSAEATLATDKRIYPRGGVVLVDTKRVNFSHGFASFLRFMLDQDTGGAIQAPGRADIYMGEGGSAEVLAGGQYAEGRLYYLFLKPQFVNQYLPMVATPAM